ncbi:uncharacterized protein LOC130923456 [Corythoichthys intestinalis]|uniref:uncharacterized protein LOC130923456 n=1 Tax=Corythoichthys intestinalis TaxID=161448 RepID=UPI0025A584BD|nr:uncharacterized protein LOC130923456 [Corythoichthys intestinalis]
MPHCSAIGCTNRTDGKHNPPDLSFHSFPTRDRGLLKKWLHNVGREMFTPTKASKLCSAHFLPDCFKVDVYEKYGLESKERQRRKRRLLEDDAVPTEFVHRSTQQVTLASPLSQMEKKERKRQINQRLRDMCHESTTIMTELVCPPESPKKIKVETLTGEVAELHNEEMAEQPKYLFVQPIGFVEIQCARQTSKLEEETGVPEENDYNQSVPEHHGGSPQRVKKDHAYATSKLIRSSGTLSGMFKKMKKAPGLETEPFNSSTIHFEDDLEAKEHRAEYLPSSSDTCTSGDRERHLHGADPYTSKNDPDSEEPEPHDLEENDEPAPHHIKQEEEPYSRLEVVQVAQHIQKEEEPELHHFNLEEEPQPPHKEDEAVPEPPRTGASHIKVEGHEAESTNFPLTVILKTEYDEDESAENQSDELGAGTFPANCTASADGATTRQPNMETRVATNSVETSINVAQPSRVNEVFKVHAVKKRLSPKLDNSVKSLLMTPFKKRTLTEKLQVKERGPHQPDIQMNQHFKDKGANCTHTFSKTWFANKAWLTGCSETNALFCFPCLLFQMPQSDPLWIKTGLTDLKHFDEEAKNHELTTIHVENALRLAMFGKASIACQLDESYRLGIRKNNEVVDKNRQMLSEIIDRIKFCDAFEFSLHNQNESKGFENPAVFRVLVDFAAALETDLHEHLQNIVFEGISKTLQNELLDCMSLVLREGIVEEIQSADYVSIQADQIMDISAQCHLALVFRYIDKSHDVHERLFELMPLRHATTDSIATMLLDQLSVVIPDHQKKKLICQAYDGSSVINDTVSSVPKKIEHLYENAHYIHSYAHQLNDIMQQVTSSDPQVTNFFSDLAHFSTFFSKSPKRIAKLDNAVAQRLPRVGKIEWNFQSQAVLTVFRHKEHLLQCFETIIESGEFDSNTVRDARGLVRILEDDTFSFFLRLFHLIMLHISILDNLLQEQPINSIFIKEIMQNFTDSIHAARDSLPSLGEEHRCSLPSLAKRHQTLGQGDHQMVATKVCNTILNLAKERFAFTTHLISATLLLADRYEHYCSNFPEMALNSTVEAYPLLNKNKLKMELGVIYGNDEFRNCKSVVALYQLFMRNGLQDTFSETVTLLKILITIPMMTTESDRCFSTLKKIKTFLQNAVSHNHLNALAVIAMERNFIKSIPDFNHRVIEKFSSHFERGTFTYKK